MNRALWKKAFGEVRVALPCFLVLMFGFQVLFVWVTSQLDLQLFEHFLRNMPDYWKRLLPVSVDSMATYQGRIAIGYDHPLVAFGTAFWAIARGSDAVSGPLNRGTLEMVLAQPVRRVEVLASNAVIATVGAALMAAACWLGTCTGVALIPKLHDVPAMPYGFCALNLFAYSFFLAGFTTLLSSADRYRGRTIGLAAGFYVVSLVLKVVGRTADGFPGLLYGSFLTAYEPQRFVDPQYDAATIAVTYNLPLLLIGMMCYIVAAAIFSRRDLPAPL
jgi:ABC-2 type transport system permease protein